MVGHLWTIEVGGTSRKFKTLKFERKLDMNSPTKFTAKIDYSSDIGFMDTVVMKRNGTAEWKGYVERMRTEWDQNGRYLNLEGRDAAFIIWKKYLEDFGNYAEKTAGFFGQVNAMELILFMLRSPHSDPANSYDSTTGWKLQYPNNKEGWGLDSSKLQCSAYQTKIGDAQWTVLRRRAFGWRNTGNPFADSIAEGWGTVVDTGSKAFVLDHWTPTGSSPYLNDTNNATYIKSNISYSGDESAAEFYFTDSPSNLTSINNLSVELWFKTDSSIWWWDRAHFAVYLWVPSMAAWVYLFDQTCGGQANLNWTPRIVDVTNYIKTKSDIDGARLKIINVAGANLSTYIGFTRLVCSYSQSGMQTIDDRFDITFPAQDIMGIYFESRMDDDSYPRNYEISTLGAIEAFTGWNEVDPEGHITLQDSDTTIQHYAYQNETAYLDKYYPNGIGDFDIVFSFMISSTTPHPYAFVPFCLSENEEDYKTMINTSGHYFTSLEVKSSAGALSVRARLKVLGETAFSDYVSLAPSTRYYVEVKRSGSRIHFIIFNKVTMTADDVILDENIYTTQEFHYRFQALTYNGLEWGTDFINTMDSFVSSGEKVTNGEFEDGNFTGWSNPSGNPQVVTTSPHSGTYCAKFFAVELGISQSFSNIPKTSVTSFILWHKAHILGGSGPLFKVILHYSDSTSTPISLTDATNTWNAINLLSSWVDGKLLSSIEMYSETGALIEQYIDDVSLVTVSTGLWSRTGGDATRTTETTIKAEGIGSQKIVATAGQKFYFEEDIDNTAQVKVDGWVRVPAPSAELLGAGFGINLKANSHTASGFPQWTGQGDSPYLYDDDDTNVVISDAETTGEFTNEWGFEDLDAKYGSLVPDSSSKLTVKAKLYDGVGGHATQITLQIKIYEKHQDAWITVGVMNVTDTSYQTQDFTGLDTFLESLEDWQLAKIKINVLSITGGGSDKGGIRVTYAYLHCTGVGYMGHIYLMKLYDSDVETGPDPLTGYSAGLAVVLDPTASSNQDKWRWQVDGFSDSGTWNTAIQTGGVVSADSWYLLRLYSVIDSSNGSISLYEIVDGSEIPIVSITGLDNHNYGPVDRYDFEASFDVYNFGTAYLDWTQVDVQSIGPTLGYVYGSKITTVLITVTGNAFRDIIHSWNPVNINNIRIRITENDLNHSWAVSQVYIYGSTDIKFRPFLGGVKDTNGNVLAIPDIAPTPPSPYHYVGGPYIKYVQIHDNFSYPIGPVNIGRQRVLDALNFIVQQCYDEYYNVFEWWVSPDNDNTLHISSQKGSDKSATIIFEKADESEEDHGKAGGNKREKFIDDTVQRVYVVGEGEQKTQQEASVWVESQDGMDDVKTFYEEVDHEKSLTPDEKGNPSVAEIIGEVYIKKNATRRDQTVFTVNIDPYDSMSYDVGDETTINDSLTNTSSESFRIMNIEKNVDNQGEVVTLTLGYPQYRFEDEIQNIYTQLKKIGAVGVIKPDWTAQGIDQTQINADSISSTSQFEKSAKDEEATIDKDIRNPQWSISPSGTLNDYSDGKHYQYATPSSGHGMEWRKSNDWMALLGPSEAGINSAIRVAIIGNEDTTELLTGEVFDIGMDRNPSVVFEIKCYEDHGGSPVYWDDGDFFIVGLKGNIGDYDENIGFWFYGVKDGSIVHLHAQYSLDGVTIVDKIIRDINVGLPLDQEPSYGQPPDYTTFSFKYRLEIVTEATMTLPDGSEIEDPHGIVTFNVYDLNTLDGSGEKNPTTVVGLFNGVPPSHVRVLPLYAYLYGQGGTSRQAKLYIYRYRTKWKRCLT